MKKSNSSKKIIIALIIGIAVIFLISFTAAEQKSNQKNNFVQSVLADVVGIFDRAISAPVKWIGFSVQAADQLFNTYEENNQLKRKLDQYAALESENADYKAENAKLKEQLELNKTLTNYAKVNGSVISRSPDSWQDILVIDKGTKDGIEVNMPVMGDKGLIGRVVEANTTSSKVSLLTSENQNTNHFPVMIAPSGAGDSAYGLIKKYDEKSQAFIISEVTTTDNLKAGDRVTTSGLGGSSPKGLYIGTVQKVTTNQFGLEKEIYVKPAASLYDITTVTVIKRLAESEEVNE